MNQSSSSDFIAKLWKKVSCYYLPSDSAVSKEDVSDHHHEKQQQQPPQQLSTTTTSTVDLLWLILDNHDNNNCRQPPHQLLICYGGVGVNKESMKTTEVPMKYVSSSVTFRALLEQSGVELETTLSRGWVVIWCEFTEVESTLKLVKAIVKAEEREKKSSLGKLVKAIVKGEER